MPAFGLNATAKIGQQPLASGKVSIAWPDISNLSTLSIDADAAFKGSFLPFAFDADNPRATVTQILTAAHTGVKSLRNVIATDPELVKSLPFAGRSAAELDPMLAKLQTKLEQLIAIDENLTLEEVEKRIEQAMGDALRSATTSWTGSSRCRTSRRRARPAPRSSPRWTSGCARRTAPAGLGARSPSTRSCCRSTSPSATPLTPWPQSAARAR